MQRNSDMRHVNKRKQPRCPGRSNSEGQEFATGSTSTSCALEILDHLESNHGSRLLHRPTRDNNNIRQGKRMGIPRPLSCPANLLNTHQRRSQPSHIYHKETATLGAGQPLGFGRQVHLQQLVWHSGRCGRWWII